MKVSFRIWTLLSSCLILPFMTMAQQNNNTQLDQLWHKYDSLMDYDLRKDAKVLLGKIEPIAKQQGAKGDILKIKMLQQAHNLSDEELENNEYSNIYNTKGFATNEVEEALLSYMKAKTFRQNLEYDYEINNRTPVDRAASDMPIEEWTSTQYSDTINKLFNAAFGQQKSLEQQPVDPYARLLFPSNNSSKQNNYKYSSLYELMLQDYLEQQLYELNNSRYDFNNQMLNDPRFLTADVPAYMAITDWSALKNNYSKAAQAYQKLLRYYTDRNIQERLAEWDLKRVQFFQEHFGFTNKKTLEEQAYKRLEQTYPTYEAGLSAWFYRQNTAFNSKKISKRAYSDILEQKIKTVPNSETKNTLIFKFNELNRGRVSLTVEEFIPINENAKFLIEYTNVAQIEVAVIPYTKLKKNENFNDYKTRLANIKPIKSYTINLPAIEDLEQHSVEHLLDPLPSGEYMLLVKGLNRDYGANFTNFGVTNISYVQKEDKIYVVDRNTGKPLADAQVNVYRNGREWVSAKVDDEGVALLKTANKYLYTDSIVITHKGDKLVRRNSNLLLDRNRNEVAQNRTFLYTDRSIYRPGQTIYFKGIVVQHKGQKAEVVADKKVDVIFRDANYQVIKTMVLTTNEYGSFQGSFDAPTTGLTGGMSIEATNASVHINVEEYKRPTYTVTFDTLNQSYFVNDKIVVSGNAKAFAGNVINDATVTYAIERETMFLFLWRCYWWPRPEVQNETVGEGTTTTDALGKFSIPFIAQPDGTNPELWPVFRYKIVAKVTDISGETHEFTQYVQAGYRDALIVAHLSKSSDVADLKKFTVSITNLNHVPLTKKSYEVKVEALAAPKNLRERLWQTPDQFLYDEATFRSLFPKDVYKDEATVEKMPVVKTTFVQTFTGPQTIDFIAKDAMPKNGWYVVTITTKDDKGNEVIQKFYTHAFVNEKETIQAPLHLSANKIVAEPGEEVALKIWTPDNAAYPQVFLNTRDNKQSTNITKFKVGEEHRGNVYYEVFYVKDNRLYAELLSISIPYSNKDLKIQWKSHRNILLPGSKEQWSFSITGNKAEQLEAELLASMYDASLDALKPHEWDVDNLMLMFYPWNRIKGDNFYVKQITDLYPNGDNKFAANTIDNINKASIPLLAIYHSGRGGGTKLNYVGSASRIQYDAVYSKAMVAESAAAPVMEESVGDDYVLAEPGPLGFGDGPSDKAKQENSTINSVRTNFNETAFFLPQLKTNNQGEVSFEFTIPEALTTWNLNVLAHTKDWKIGTLNGSVQTQKDVMVQPNLPRFFRQGDEVVLKTKVANMSAQALDAKVTLALEDAALLKDVSLPFVLKNATQQVSIPAGQSKEVSWVLRIPESMYEPVKVRITADAGAHMDGEEHLLPIVTNRMLVTETMPLPMLGNGTKEFDFTALRQATSPTIAHKNITIEYTSNPTWYVVQALPYLTSYPYDCAEQTFSKFYANALAADIMSKSPRMKEVVEQWQQKESDALLSNLEKNESLKSALLEETPWVLEAQSESAQKQRLAALFETNRISKDLNKSLNKLHKLQMSNGAFGWFEGMQSNRYITQTIVLGLLKMQSINIKSATEDKATNIVSNAIPYLETELETDYKNIEKYKGKLENNNLSPSIVQYLLIDALNANKKSTKTKTYYLGQIKKYWKEYSLMTQAQMATILYHNGELGTAKTIVESLRQRSIKSDEMGRYWKNNTASYRWFEAPIETHASLIQAFRLVDPKAEELAELQTWLIKNKQTNRWHSTTATVEAAYALLGNSTEMIDATPNVQIKVGGLSIDNSDMKTQSGTGYFKQQIPGTEVNKEMGNIQVSVSNAPSSLPTWGAIYWQYFEDMNKIPAAPGAQLNIRKEQFVATQGPNGEKLVPITVEQPIKMGDKVVVRLVVQADRDMEYIHIKDTRAACLAPKDVLSTYHWNSGLGYYQSTKDISTNYFIDRLPKGTYVLEYATYANALGTYSNGMATIQCMYAPEFAAHSQGSKMEVK